MATTEAEVADPAPAVTEEDFNRAKEMLHSLFGIMGIQKVIVVDDQLSTPLDFEKIVGAIRAKVVAAGDEPVALEIEEFAGIPLTPEVEVWRGKVEQKWNALEIERKDAIGRALGVVEEPESKESERHVLERILGDAKPDFLSLTEWKTRADELIAAAKAGATLFLFDQDMRENAGREDEGMNIISHLLKNECQTGPVYFGLFSNTVGADDEHDHHIAFMEKYGLGEMGDRFAVISKSGLDTQPRNLACRLKRVAISPRCSALKSGIFTAVEKAMLQAKKDVEGLHIYDFEHLVFRSSYNEGVWEVDTLLRLFSVFFRESARATAATDGAIRKAAEDVRKVVSYPYRPNDAPAAKVRDIARLELYETAKHLQTHRIPIELGDIFKKKGGKQLYMLLEQPCDLMVRGGNDNKGKRNVEFVTLAPIEFIKGDAPQAMSKLEYYSDDKEKEAYVRLEKCVTVPICILDLCVCSDDGVAKLDVGKKCPDGMIPAWQERYKILTSKAEALLAQYKGLVRKDGVEIPGLTPAIKDMLQATVLQAVPGVVTGKIDLDAKKIVYAIERVGNLRQPWSGGILREYAYHKARDAFEHDWTRTEEKKKPKAESAKA